jgi:DNA polymerase-3 subunit chi
MRVSFHFNVAQPYDYVIRLSRKVLAQHPRMVVHAPAARLAALSEHLWAAAPGSFLAHALPEDGQPIQARSRIVLADRIQALASDVWVNLDQTGPLFDGQAARVVEIVGPSDEERVAGRRRWRQYASMGCEMDGHDATARQ